MLIDASLGRACGCGAVPVQQMQPQPVLPQRTEPDALFVQMSTAQTDIASGAALPLAGSVRQIGDGISYDAANHAVVVCEPGVYAFDWNVLVTAAAAGDDVVITLQSLDGTTVLASSGAVAVPAEGGVLLSGHAVAPLRAGSAWALVNASAGAVSIPVAGAAPAVFAASLTVAEVD